MINFRVWSNHDCGFHSQSQSWLCFHNHDCANFGRPKWPQSQSQSFPTITISNHFLQSDCWLWLWNDWLWGHNLIAIISPGHVASCNLTWFNTCFAWFWIRYSLAFGCIWILNLVWIYPTLAQMCDNFYFRIVFWNVFRIVFWNVISG